MSAQRHVTLSGGERVPYPEPTSEAATKIGKANTRVDSKCEVALRSHLHRRGLRFRKDLLIRVEGLRVRPDVVFAKAKVAVFVDGCFWHGCPDHATWPKNNADFWRAKIEGNQARDRDTDARLAAAGWRVLRVWEHEDPTTAARRVQAALGDTICT